MQTNQIPTFDPADNETGCCPRFHPELWDNQELHFENKPFVKASTTSAFHVPLNMGPVFTRTWQAIKDADADPGGHLVLSHDESAWQSDHFFAVAKDVPGADMVHLSGDFVTKVFEGPFSDARKWCKEMERQVQAKGKRLDLTYLFYTTCPRCAKHYGKNYVVGVSRVRSGD
jgi:Bacterial hydrolase